MNFVKSNKDWLNDFALFMAAKDFHGGELWTKWNKDLVLRKENALKEWKEKLS